jgi:hypothetical protein
MTEQWKEIPNRAGYEVSDRGRVRSLPRRLKYEVAGCSFSDRKILGRVLRQHRGVVVLQGHRTKVVDLVAALFPQSAPAGDCHS